MFCNVLADCVNLFLFLFFCRCEWFDGVNWHTGHPLGRATSALTLTYLPMLGALKSSLSTSDYLDRKKDRRLYNIKESPGSCTRSTVFESQGQCFDLFPLPVAAETPRDKSDRILSQLVQIVKQIKSYSPYV